MTGVCDRLANAFPLWVLGACAAALVEPGLFTWFREPWITRGLGLIMLGMGITLTPRDFVRVARRPAAVAAGFVAQFLIMPAAGWGVATALDLDAPFAIGLILVGCCPGGTASNVVTSIARLDVPLSVLMTACSTTGAIVLTPFLASRLLGERVEVPAVQMVGTMVTVVAVPVVAGMVLRRLAPSAVRSAAPAAALVSVLTIALVCASIVGQNAAAVLDSGPRLLGAVVLMHAIGFAAGHAFTRLLGYDRTVARTVSIETGMQNSGLGVVLAQRHFPVEPLAAVPGAISAVVHSVIGSILAGWWRWRPAPTVSDASSSSSPSAGA